MTTTDPQGLAMKWRGKGISTMSPFAGSVFLEQVTDATPEQWEKVEGLLQEEAPDLMDMVGLEPPC